MDTLHFKLLESFGLKDGKYISYPYHFTRLQKSASYFNFILNLNKIHDNLCLIKNENLHGLYKVRLLVDNVGNLEWDVLEIHSFSRTLSVTLAKNPINRSNKFLYHKTTIRTVYNQAKMNKDEFFDVLLWNKQEELTEFTIGNLVYEMNQTLYTPPVEAGLLAGTFREELLMNGEIEIKSIYKSQINQVTKLWLINSVREWVEVQLKL